MRPWGYSRCFGISVLGSSSTGPHVRKIGRLEIPLKLE